MTILQVMRKEALNNRPATLTMPERNVKEKVPCKSILLNWPDMVFCFV